MSKVDERFKELGFILDTKETNIEDEIILYHKGAQVLEINRGETYFYYEMDEIAHLHTYSIKPFTFSLYEKIKPIVEDKKREVGWIE